MERKTLKSVFARYEDQAFPFKFHGTLVCDTIAAGTPTDPNVAEGWLKTKLSDSDDLIRQAVAETMTELNVDVEKATDIVNKSKHFCAFKRDPERNGELYIEGRQLKSAIKESSNIVWAGEKWGPTKKGTKSFFPEHVFVSQDKLHLGVSAPTDVVQSFPKSRFGSSIQYNEYVQEAKIDFTVITDFEFKAGQWGELWLHMEQNGLGAMRSQGFGRFTVVKWERDK